MEEISRDILIQHLYDLRALEIAKHNLENKCENNARIISGLGYNKVLKKPSFYSVIIAPCIVFAVILVFLFALNEYLKHGSGYVISLSSIMNLRGYIIIGSFTTITCAIAFVIAFAISSGRMTKYKNELSKEKERLESETKHKERLVRENSELNNKLVDLRRILKESYSMNIIPQQYRNLNSVCYLYDYLSTSQQSFETAILNYNINAVNESVQKVIGQQSEMILQQYITNARLEGMERHSARMAQQLNSIEANTANAAKYSAISATHAKANTFFQAYDFLKNN